MHPLLIPSASPFTLGEDSSLSPTFCSSLDPCSSHGFSSLQSPLAFPSFFSNDSCQQIEAFQPLSLDSAELCRCHLQRCNGEASLDITQDDSVSQSNLNILTPEEGLLLHHTDSQCPFHSAPNQTLLQNDFGLLQESASTEHSVSLPSYPSLLQDDTECSAFSPIQGGDYEKDQPVLREFNLALLHTHDSNYVYYKNGYACHSQIDKTRQFESFETHNQVSDTTCIDAHSKHSCYKSSCITALDIVSAVLTPSTLIARNGYAGDKANFIEAHINGSRVRRVRLLDNLDPPCSIESNLDHIREAKKEAAKKEALQEVHDCKKPVYSSCKEMFIHVNAIDEASKENRSPHVLKQSHKGIGVKTDSSGWKCPKDAKKKFKPKPRQLLLDKWLARQR